MAAGKGQATRVSARLGAAILGGVLPHGFSPWICSNQSAYSFPSLQRTLYTTTTTAAHFPTPALNPSQKPYPYTHARTLRELLVFGLPGNPVSSLVTFHLVVLPCLRKLEGWPQPGLRRVHVRTTMPIRRGGRA